MTTPTACPNCNGTDHVGYPRAGNADGEPCIRSLADRIAALESGRAGAAPVAPAVELHEGAISEAHKLPAARYRCGNCGASHAFAECEWMMVYVCGSCAPGMYAGQVDKPPTPPAPAGPRATGPRGLLPGVASAYETLRAALAADADYRRGWSDNIAMVLHDRHGITGHAERNAAAKDIMDWLFPVAAPAESPGDGAWTDLGDISAVPPDRSVAMSCDKCRVRWRGCADVFECPRCGEGAPPWNPCEPAEDGVCEALHDAPPVAEAKVCGTTYPQPAWRCVLSDGHAGDHGWGDYDGDDDPQPAAPPVPVETVSHVAAYRAHQDAADPVNRHNGCIEVLRRYIREREVCEYDLSRRCSELEAELARAKAKP